MDHGERAWSGTHDYSGLAWGKGLFLRSISGAENLSATLDPVLALFVVAIHTISHLAVSGVIAWLVYDFVGLAVLRRAWINLDLIWCCSLLGAAVVLLFVPVACFVGLR